YVFYAVPIFFGAWLAGPTVGIVFCCASVFAWMIVDLRLTQWEPFIVLWNAALRLSFFIGISIVISLLKSNLEREKASARIDFLTELPNRRVFLAAANQERERAIRHKHPLTIAYVDLDDFKEMNDRSGHDIGDILLKEVGSVLKQNIRSSDSVARIGGDEFVVLLPETNFESGQVAIHKLQESWKKQMRDKHWNISLSIGAVTYVEHFPEVKEMLTEADRLMYAAKASGKNRIRHELADLSTTATICHSGLRG
ncbi:GGDEF domain-containing protein, partial [bacterium]|nr:GGDEF domain-containing protein [bacterium]